MPSPSEKADTVGQKTFAAPKSAGQQAPSGPSKNLDLLSIPILLKHMTLAIYEHKFGGADGLNTMDATRASKPPPRASNFAEAFAIARGRLVEYRHLTPGSLKGPIGKITLTGSGRQLESHHRREAGGGKKTKRFDLLYTKFLMPKPTVAPTVPEKRGGA